MPQLSTPEGTHYNQQHNSNYEKLQLFSQFSTLTVNKKNTARQHHHRVSSPMVHPVMKRSSPRASAPSAIDTTTTGPITSPLTSPKSPDSVSHGPFRTCRLSGTNISQQYHEMEMRFSYESETTMAPLNSRKDSGITTHTSDASRPLGRSKSHNKNVNAHSYCGRHSSEYLFGGHSIRELLSNLKHRRDSREQ